MLRRAVTALAGVVAAILTMAPPVGAQDDIPALVAEATTLVESELRLMHALGALDVNGPGPEWLSALLETQPPPVGTRSALVDQLTAVEQAAQNIRDELAARGHQVSGSVDSILLMQPPGVHTALRSGDPTTPVTLSSYRRALDDLEQRQGLGFEPTSPGPDGPPDSDPFPVPAPAVAAGSTVFVALPILLLRRRRRQEGSDEAALPAGSGVAELELGRRLMTAAEPSVVGQLVIDHARRSTGATRSALVELSAAGVPLVLAAEPEDFGAEVLLSTRSWDQAMDTGRLALCRGPEGTTRACLPVVAAGRVTAVLVLGGLAEDADSPVSLDVIAVELAPLDRLAPTIGTALEAAARFDGEAQAARSDGLTGLANRRRFDDDLQKSVPGWLATGLPVACAMVDIDHFKSINDQFGHQAGDEVLRRVAALLESAVRADDIVYRYGGEEFSVLLPGATEEVAERVAERIRQTVEQTSFDDQAGTVTVSVGVTAAAGVETVDLVRRADEALYDAKRSGRNRVVTR